MGMIAEWIGLLIIAGVVALSLAVPVALVVYLGALVLFSDLKEDDEM